MRPPVPYFGAKGNTAGRIVARLPKHGHYVEPFAGSLAVLLAKPRSRMETVNDLDGDLMTFWRVLRNRPDELARACALTPHSRAEHTQSRVRDEICELEIARRVFVALTQGRSRTVRGGRDGWRYFQSGSNSRFGMPEYLAAYNRRLIAAAERINLVSLECRPALEVIAAYGRAQRCADLRRSAVPGECPRAFRSVRGRDARRAATSRPRGRAARLQGRSRPVWLRIRPLRP